MLIFKSFITNSISFIIKHWRIILVCLILCIAYYYKASYERTTHEFEAYKTLIANETAKIKEKEAIAVKKVAKLIESHNQIEVKLVKDKTKLSKDLKGLYDVKTNADYRLSAYSQRLSMQPYHSTSDIASNTSELAECKSNFDSAFTRLSTIEQACAVTTNDYNLLRSWADEACTIAECK